MFMKKIKETTEPKNEEIRKVGEKKWCLYSKKKGKDGNRKKLGCYSSRKAAKKREKQVNHFKNVKERYNIRPRTRNTGKELGK